MKRTRFTEAQIIGVLVAVAAAFPTVGQLADISNSGTLFAFFMVAASVLVLRLRDPGRHRPFRVPLVWLVAPAAGIRCFGPVSLFRFRLSQQSCWAGFETRIMVGWHSPSGPVDQNLLLTTRMLAREGQMCVSP